MSHEEKFVKRLTDLRQEKGQSAREMSLSLGQNENYINRIENHKALPSMTVFFYICDYFGITPEEFFAYQTESPALSKELLQELSKLSRAQTEHLLQIVKDINT